MHVQYEIKSEDSWVTIFLFWIVCDDFATFARAPFILKYTAIVRMPHYILMLKLMAGKNIFFEALVVILRKFKNMSYKRVILLLVSSRSWLRGFKKHSYLRRILVKRPFFPTLSFHFFIDQWLSLLQFRFIYTISK